MRWGPSRSGVPLPAAIALLALWVLVLSCVTSH